MKKPLILPTFKDEDDEREFWTKIDLGDYLEPEDLQPASFPNLKPSSRPVSLRIPTYIITRIKEKANAIGIPYQALIKEKIAELAK
jgi:predicted DNA binding CopG/RHH family protein